MAKEILLTKEGYEKLKERLDYLQTSARPQASEKIKIAREFGDLSENAEYDAAKEEQVHIENEIKEINEKLMAAVLIDESNVDTKVVSLGCTVKIHDMEFGDKLEFKIVGSTEADSSENKISNESPIAQAILGKKKGAVCDVITPGGGMKVKILSIGI
ncbi:MAG: transcription elongation factor GreA [Clostridiales bacterium]|jgi:transcription elongation factor GreA|nr:transcription elongation factor GreA [Clostridiales bacterium]